ncbi:methyltransferase domain-containing protein [Mesorhizobium sp.]|jgi:SAM-dependent methyltransferase|uniref:class I SAM-dependent methyltransferase n=1 Tax=Mesorhizobium sp. TaxID=1871066 RepID=UPI00257BC261|nr:methyltransferase domain-containing protein [Mesorhizobium sp.]
MFAHRLLPKIVKKRLRRLMRYDRPGVGRVRFGDFERTDPISRNFGYDRGTPIDRIYIERFLAEHASSIHGRTLEVVDDDYTARFGGPRTTQRDIVDLRPENTRATIVGDLTSLGAEWNDKFDAIVLTQTLHLIFDLQKAVSALFRLLKSGGTVLVTVPGLTPIDHHQEYETWYWSLTEASARRLFSDVFGADSTHIAVYGNVCSAVCFLEGIAAEELKPEMLHEQDHHFPVTIGICATKG